LQMSNFEPPKWGWLLRAGVVTVIAGVGVATFEAELFVFRRITLDQIVQYQAGVYAILTLGFSLVLAAIVDKRIENLERRLERKFDSRSRGCPRGHRWPVDGCPYCRRDSRYLY